MLACLRAVICLLQRYKSSIFQISRLPVAESSAISGIFRLGPLVVTLPLPTFSEDLHLMKIASKLSAVVEEYEVFM